MKFLMGTFIMPSQKSADMRFLISVYHIVIISLIFFQQFTGALFAAEF